jgi:VanZ family protein
MRTITTLLPVVLFVSLLALWTWKLLEPNPLPDAVEREIPSTMKFVLAKSLHAAAYACLTILAAFLPVSSLGFRAVILLLALHGIGTEIGQTYVPNRTGSVRDVAIDWSGIGVGLLAIRCGRGYWSRNG